MQQGWTRGVKARDRDVGASRDRLQTETSRPHPWADYQGSNIGDM